ncbi:hydroxysqualene dehydroxylase HpnE [Aristophania vespae]|uniref:hydroxysqualene dehydroxylase HpnE n=1 Tax=Aristophania vespae TaxID=2697033 RepID=UPI0023513BC0|nr:hydroxysqualene dehydroxylase HpnE [Aristophania vespae]UMM64722.1 Hydroxysqualene dehydroxylase [Aristophania vespae]
MSHVHIIGGGLAGLSAAVELAPQAQVTLYEAGPVCGGRARSYYDRTLEVTIDNGNHMLLSANPYSFRYLDLIGARNTLKGPGKPIFPWYDLDDGLRWCLRLSKGKIPFWLLSRRSRVPGMDLKEVLSLRRLMKANDKMTVAECLSSGEFTRRLLAPLAISALNTDLESASAALLGNIIKKTLAQGGQACCPWVAKNGLSESFVNPALTYLEKFHSRILFGTRVSALRRENGRVISFRTFDREIVLGAEDSVILAVPAPVASSLLPELEVPNAFESIANAHYRLPYKIKAKGDVGKAGFIGLVGGMAEWVFLHDNVLSVTVSAANRYSEYSNETMLDMIWEEISQALGAVIEGSLPLTTPASRFIREKRATFAATPEQNKRRPGAKTSSENLALAGDWTDTGFPSTIEGAIQSGLEAVAALGFRSAVKRS